MRIGSVFPAVLRKDAATELQDCKTVAWMLLMFPILSLENGNKSVTSSKFIQVPNVKVYHILTVKEHD